MATKLPSNKAQAWRFFDRIVSLAAPGGHYSNPWVKDSEGRLEYQPDFATLEQLLGVPLYLNAATTTGVPALALDVWLSYELRRAGFDADTTWPRAEAPRVLPAPVASLLHSLPVPERKALLQRILATAPTGVAPSQALILGKNYRKQVDVVMSNWSTGPEVLISTKRMDSSFGKNAQNRIEEAYGDAKNLRLRHPMAALGFFFGIRSTAFTAESRTAEFIADLLLKLGEEEDAYHATCLLPIEYGIELPAKAVDAVTGIEVADEQLVGSQNSGSRVSDSEQDAEYSSGSEPAAEVHTQRSSADANPTQEPQKILAEPFDMFDVPEEPPLDEPEVEWQDTFNFDQGVDVDAALAKLPQVRIREDFVPSALRAGTFLEKIVARVLAATPTTLHETARDRLKEVRHG
ncbi:hypothetical protein VR010_13860 [Actinomycetaceae bacterium L2_0104]